MTENTQAYHWKQLEVSADKPVWITTEQELEQHCSSWAELPLIALDTEFQRVETFYPIPGLIQVADDKQCYLIDPLEIEDFSALKALFEDRSVLKLMHAASEDLELFLKVIGVLPQPLFDTQLGAALINWGFSMGLQRMLEQKLGVQMEKHETTSDWLQRPLTASQEHYAALDVAYLPAIYALQLEEFEQRGTVGWIEQENQALLDEALVDDPEGYEYYKRFTQMWRAPDHKLAALRDLTAWREQQARKRDVPRNRILRNQALLQIVENWPRSIGELSRLDEVKKRILRTDGETILTFLKNSQKSVEDNPPESIARPLHFFWNKHLKSLKAIARRKAEENNIAPEVLLKRKELELIIRSGLDDGEYALPDKMTLWRQQMLGHLLLDKLEEIEKHRSEGA
ncbi:ribonuclease D [Neptuniibacter sp.]|uniref:ribonuclease D n=1 Tax=Neptuniibacter sp. TaxID=1962643 RepID=UPI002614B843|nr:ribonuclease D [Neptuniibacter sp.]MCP4596592.1 ribonuclease D [Neptuniibacter sp.]